MLETIIILVLISIIVRSTFITSGVYKIRRGWNFSGIWFMKMFFSKRKPFYVKVVIDRSFMVKTLGVYICFYHDITEQYEMGRYLFPYFEQDGDDEKGAPHEMIIRLDFSKKIDQSLLKFSLKQI
jgi:hypothetical protein